MLETALGSPGTMIRKESGLSKASRLRFLIGALLVAVSVALTGCGGGAGDKAKRKTSRKRTKRRKRSRSKEVRWRATELCREDSSTSLA